LEEALNILEEPEAAGGRFKVKPEDARQ